MLQKILSMVRNAIANRRLDRLSFSSDLIWNIRLRYKKKEYYREFTHVTVINTLL